MEPEPVKKILGAGQKWTGSATLIFEWQYRAGAGAKIMGKVEPELELEPKLNNFGSVTLVKISYYVPLNKLYFTPY